MKLIVSLYTGNVQIAEQLVKKCAALNLKGGESERTPLHYAAKEGDLRKFI